MDMKSICISSHKELYFAPLLVSVIRKYVPGYTGSYTHAFNNP